MWSIKHQRICLWTHTIFITSIARFNMLVKDISALYQALCLHLHYCLPASCYIYYIPVIVYVRLQYYYIQSSISVLHVHCYMSKYRVRSQITSAGRALLVQEIQTDVTLQQRSIASTMNDVKLDFVRSDKSKETGKS